ncbi:MAG: single-stranded-DNA-specific exonuclease RecJ [Schwartzia sp.]|nr:single-stranded-DNA-specific exonuclease RecJ [Schwartzia sp. (in: firmicutes)]
MEKKWRVREHDAAREEKLANAIGVPRVIAGILLSRGIETAEEAERFLSPEKAPYYDPFLMKDMDVAVERIARAIERREKIVIYGDYDVDGITSTTLLIRFFGRLGMGDCVTYYIPTREIGYGLHTEEILKLAAAGATLLLTVDCGISSADIVDEVKDKIDIVITDHHLPGERRPDALAVIDPHQKDCRYPFENLCGVGVAFKLCQAIMKKLYGREFADDMELVAIGTVADLVPLLDENRKIVKEGLAALNRDPSRILGVKELIDVSGLTGKEITAGMVGFVIAPRLNAAGRLDTAATGAELLLSSDEAVARRRARELEVANEERKNVEQDILAQAEEKIKSRYPDLDKTHVIVAYGEDWHAGVIGLVASRLTEKYYRPAIVIGMHDGIGKGSCRSIEGFSLFDALSCARDTLIQFGGHSMAAGLTVAENRIDDLEAALNKYAEENMMPDQFVPVVDGEAELSPDDVDMNFVETLSRLEPYGMDNPRPLFFCHEAVASEVRLVGRGEEKRHLMFNLGKIHAIGWNMSDMMGFATSGPIDIAYVPEVDEWNGNRYIQVKLSDIGEAGSRKIFPTRSILKKVYLAIRELSGAVTKKQGGIAAVSERQIIAMLGLSSYTTKKALKIFEELRFIEKDGEEYRLLPPPDEKIDLMESGTYRKGHEE